MKESEIVDKIKTYLKGVDGLFCFKEHGGIYGASGIPDIICCYKGRFIGFEVKTETGKLTVLQSGNAAANRESGRHRRGGAERRRSKGNP
jgi:hypothetical protein